MKISTQNHLAHRADCHTGTRRGASPGAVTFAILLLWLLPVLEAEADSLRCGRKVVRSGDAQSTVLSVCGEPQRKDTSQEAIWIGSGQKTVRVNRWYYKSSGRKLERVVWLYQGKVIAVETGGR